MYRCLWNARVAEFPADRGHIEPVYVAQQGQPLSQQSKQGRLVHSYRVLLQLHSRGKDFNVVCLE